MSKQKIVIIDDDESMLETLVSFLNPEDYSIYTASESRKGLEIIKNERPDLVISDLKMPYMDGLELLMKTKKIEESIPILIMTAYDNSESIIKAMQFGAYDYIEKPIEREKFKILVKHALETKRLSEKLAVLDSENKIEPDLVNSLVGKSPQIREIMKKIGRVSSNRMTVLIEGESGTGKEIISKIIHYSGITKDEPFIPVNASSYSSTLLESELFGHVHGAFTGAVKDKKGKFELAGSGTIFLDEISEISYDLQTKLLRVIQEKEFERVGDESIIPLKARIITATNKNLATLVKEGQFREDLYYRLNVFGIYMPPLRDRKEDIPNIALHLLKKINTEFHKNVLKIPFEVMELLQSYDWVGNVRELENTLQQAVLLAKGDVLEKGNITFGNNKNTIDVKKEQMSLEDVEKEHIAFILRKANWDKQKAGEILKITRPTLNKKIKYYNIVN
ncbi:MAG: sigma-54 dependent transcriptional regulator [Ignavibacteriaceae bacterium]|nr:sigma-54 dependent transcriptional regulator [Ignavibacteriaceae bacterium]